MALVFAAVLSPLLLAYILVAADMRTDLAELKPAHAWSDPTIALIGWPDLEGNNGGPVRLEEARWHSQQRVRLLGYMMDGYQPSRDGNQVKMFILMPEAGQFLHAAHRIPEEMAEIWLSKTVPFKYRRLVWTSGVLARTPGQSTAGRASYAIKDAEMWPAPDSDITRWYQP